MAKEGYKSGSDASYMKPKFMPDAELLPRDDSGGPEYDPYTAQFGDGGYVTGDKSHLQVRGGGSDDKITNDEVSSEPREREGRKGGSSMLSPPGPSKSKREAEET